MLLAKKAAWAAIAFILLTTGNLGTTLDTACCGSQSQRSASGRASERCQEDAANSAGKGRYRGEVDGVFGLRTRARIRGFQKAENLPVTGQLDAQTRLADSKSNQRVVVVVRRTARVRKANLRQP
jgi:peptidoglycan hydrolase-like protein with peptidoglycan-binding domain